MTNFEIALAKTLENEGGDTYTETPGDKGGATKWGISERFLTSKNLEAGESFTFNFVAKKSSLNTKDIIENLTYEQAKYLYKKYFWDANNLEKITDKNLQSLVFDMCVLIGGNLAIKILQKSIPPSNLIFDGIAGPKTINAVNHYLPYTIKPNIKLGYIQHFCNICNRDPVQSKFILGWINRVLKY